MPQNPKTSTFTNKLDKTVTRHEKLGPVTYYRWRQIVPNPMNNSKGSEFTSYPDLEVDYIFREDGVVIQEFYRLSSFIRLCYNWLDLNAYRTLRSSKHMLWVAQPYQEAINTLNWQHTNFEDIPNHIRYHYDLDSYLRPTGASSFGRSFNSQKGWHKIELPDQHFIQEGQSEVKQRLTWARRKGFLLGFTFFVFCVWLTQPWIVPLIHNILNMPYQLKDLIFSR